MVVTRTIEDIYDCDPDDGVKMKMYFSSPRNGVHRPCRPLGHGALGDICPVEVNLSSQVNDCQQESTNKTNLDTISPVETLQAGEGQGKFLETLLNWND